MPLYGFLLVTLTGENANFPEVCHGMRHVLTPASIALMIWDVTRWYTSCFSVAVFSFVVIVKLALSRCLGIGRCSTTCRFRLCIARINQIIEEKKLLEVTEFSAEIDGGMGRSESGEVGRKRGR